MPFTFVFAEFTHPIMRYLNQWRYEYMLKLLGHLFLGAITGGLWFVVLFVAALLKYLDK